MTTDRVLAVVETQRVKGYLFASPILRETRGASLLLDRLNRRETETILEQTGGRGVYLGGGAGRALFESRGRGGGFASRGGALYRGEARGARGAVGGLGGGGGGGVSGWGGGGG